MFKDGWVSRNYNVQENWMPDGGIATERRVWDGEFKLLTVDDYIEKNVVAGPLPKSCRVFRTHTGFHVGQCNNAIPIFSSTHEAKRYEEKIHHQESFLCVESKLRSVLTEDFSVNVLVLDPLEGLGEIQEAIFIRICDIHLYRL